MCWVKETKHSWKLEKKNSSSQKVQQNWTGEGRMESYCLTETLETDVVMAVQDDKYT